MRSRTLYASAMYQSYGEAMRGNRPCRYSRLSSTACRSVPAASPVRIASSGAVLTVDGLVLTAVLAGVVAFRSARPRQRGLDERARLHQDELQVLLAAEALRVQLVDILSAGRSRREPAMRRDHLEAANRGTVARRVHEHLLDGIAGELRCMDIGG